LIETDCEINSRQLSATVIARY